VIPTQTFERLVSRLFRYTRSDHSLGVVAAGVIPADIVGAMGDHTAEVVALISAKREFSAYGPSHWAVLAVFAIGSAALVWIGRRQSESQARLLGRVLGAVTAVVYGAGLVHSLLGPTVAGWVPLRLTDLATVTAAYALWSQRHWAFALTYYWGLVLSTQALISPVLYTPDFPSYFDLKNPRRC